MLSAPPATLCGEEVAMSASIEIHCDEIECDEVFDVFTTADATGSQFAIKMARENGWHVGEPHDFNTPALCAEHARLSAAPEPGSVSSRP